MFREKYLSLCELMQMLHQFFTGDKFTRTRNFSIELNF